MTPDEIVSAKRQAARAKAKQARAAAAAEHRRLTDQGWPPEWSPVNVKAWTELGGTLPSAQRGVAGGWSFAELSGGFGFGPSGDAGGRVRIGGAGPSDVVGLGVVLRVERRTPATRHVIEVLKTPDGWALTHDGTTTRVDADNLEGVIDASPQLHRLPLGEQVSFHCPEQVLTVDALVPHLRVTGPKTSEGPAWTDDEDASERSEEDELIDEIVGQSATCVHRWAMFNDTRLTGIRIPGAVDVVVVDLDEEQLLPLEILAEGSWYSESGGAPISWDGRSMLARVSARLAMVHTQGDQDPGTYYLPMPRAQAQQVGVVAEWVTDQGYDAAAALSLEPFDPKGTLSPAVRSEWKEMLDGLELDIDTALGPEATAQLRRRLKRTSSIYRSIARALDSPRGRLGREFWAALEEVNNNGVLGPVVWFGQ